MRNGRSKPVTVSAGVSLGSLVTALCFSAAVAQPAIAQVAAPGAAPDSQATPGAAPDSQGNAQLGDIVVTAQFRKENVQRTPLAITAVNADMIQKRGYRDISDLASVAPNVTFSPSVGINSGATLYIRGIGQADANPAFEPGVGVYIDDVYYGSVAGADLGLLDLDRVEILRGPQGTLAGANSIGGAVKLFTQKPKGDNSGYVEAGYGSRNAYDLRGALDVPLIRDQLALRVSGALSRVGGYVDQIDFTCAHPSEAGTLPSLITRSDTCRLDKDGRRTSQALRAALRWTPDDKLEVNLSGDISTTETNANPQVLYAVNESAVEAPYQAQQMARWGVKLDSRFLPPPGSYVTYQTFQDLDHSKSVNPDGETQSWGFTGTIDYQFNDHISLKSISAYRHSYIDGPEDGDGTPLDGDTAQYFYNINQFTQELRLNGNALDGLVEWTVGGFYFHSTEKLDGQVSSRYALSAFPGGLNFLVDDRLGKTKEAGYATLILHPTEKLTVTGGYRYTHSKLEYDFGRVDPDPPSVATNFGLIDLGKAPDALTSKSDYRLAVSYQWTPTIMTYAQFATGFKDGGINPTPTTVAQEVPFRPETLKSYEAGIKTQLLDRHLRFNLTGFVSKYRDIQLRGFVSDSSGVQAALTTNAGAATMKGLEAELEASPFAGLLLTASGSYLHFQYDDLGPAADVPNPPCMSCVNVYTPKYTSYLSAQYSFDLGDHGSVTPRVSANYRSKVYTDLDNNAMTALAGWWVIDARLGWTSSDGGLEISGSVNNVFDKYYFLQVHSHIYQGGTAIAVPGRPREFMITARKRF